MSKLKTASSFIFLLYISFSLLAQNVIQGLPPDLEESKVIFFEYEIREVTKGMTGDMKWNIKNRNKKAVKANREFYQNIPGYPYEFIVAKRSNYKALADSGYKYKFDSPTMYMANAGSDDYFNGERKNGKYVVPFYFQDLNTEDRYVVFELPTEWAYKYKDILSHLFDQL